MKKSINNITYENSYKKYILKEKNKIFTYNFKEKKCNLWSKSKFMKKIDFLFFYCNFKLWLWLLNKTHN